MTPLRLTVWAKPRVRTLACLVLMLAATVSQAQGSKRSKATHVYYVNLTAMIEERINAKRIEELYDLTSVVRDIVPDIVKALSEKSPLGPDKRFFKSFQPGEVRLKLVPPKGPPIMMDLYGNVVGAGEPHFLGPESVLKLRRLIFSAFPDDFGRPDRP